MPFSWNVHSPFFFFFSKLYSLYDSSHSLAVSTCEDAHEEKVQTHMACNSMNTRMHASQFCNEKKSHIYFPTLRELMICDSSGQHKCMYQTNLISIGNSQQLGQLVVVLEHNWEAAQNYDTDARGPSLLPVPASHVSRLVNYDQQLIVTGYSCCNGSLNAAECTRTAALRASYEHSYTVKVQRWSWSRWPVDRCAPSLWTRNVKFRRKDDARADRGTSHYRYGMF